MFCLCASHYRHFVRLKQNLAIREKRLRRIFLLLPGSTLYALLQEFKTMEPTEKKSAKLKHCVICCQYDYPQHTAKDPRFWPAAKPHSDTLARLYGLVRGYPEVIGTQLPVIRAQ